MITNYAKIASLTEKSPLSVQDRNDLLAFLGRADDATLEPIARVLKEDPGLISLLLKNYRAKESALKNRDQDAWAEIIERERVTLENMRREK